MLKTRRLNLREMWKLYQMCKPLLEDVNNVEKIRPKDFFDSTEILFGVRRSDEIILLSLPRGCAEVGLSAFDEFVKRDAKDG